MMTTVEQQMIARRLITAALDLALQGSSMRDTILDQMQSLLQDAQLDRSTDSKAATMALNDVRELLSRKNHTQT